MRTSGVAAGRVGRRLASLAAAAVATVASATLLGAQAPTNASAQPASPAPRRVRLVLSGGASVPTGGFSTYHDLGVQASGSAIISLMGQKLRLRPELAYTRFSVIEDKVRALAASLAVQQQAMAAVHAGNGVAATPQAQSLAAPKLPDLNKLAGGAVSSLLGTFANLELPLGPRGFQPYLIGGIGAVSFRTDVTTVNEALDGVQWAYNAGVGIRFKLGPLGGGLEARLRQIPVDDSKTFFKNVSTIPVSFSLVF